MALFQEYCKEVKYHPLTYVASPQVNTDFFLMFTNGLAADDIKFPCHYEAWDAMGLAKIASISRSLHQDLALKLSVS